MEEHHDNNNHTRNNTDDTDIETDHDEPWLMPSSRVNGEFEILKGWPCRDLDIDTVRSMVAARTRRSQQIQDGHELGMEIGEEDLD